jgi:Chlorite dismutase
VAGDTGPWRIRTSRAITGEGLPAASHLHLSAEPSPSAGIWTLRGVTSNERYVTKDEKAQLVAKQEPIGRPRATCAALIPIKKSAAWWQLTQEERRAIFEEQSRHTQIGLRHLPAIARRLHHCRDFSTHEPFDFLTWFEYAPEHAGDFDHLLAELRSTPEWRYVEREVDLRLEACPVDLGGHFTAV